MSLSVDIRQRTASSVNRQISIVMMFQAFTPLFLAAIPMGGSVLLIALGQSANGMMTLATPLLALIPILNPIYAICFVKSYRDVFIRTSPRISNVMATTASLTSSA
ncbi:hypothetical protein AAVH_38102 [Aphelenchoides avenae]|nr:hypothetical protein AAVH_38102 [Aphelenchus avenae]